MRKVKGEVDSNTCGIVYFATSSYPWPQYHDSQMPHTRTPMLTLAGACCIALYMTTIGCAHSLVRMPPHPKWDCACAPYVHNISIPKYDQHTYIQTEIRCRNSCLAQRHSAIKYQGPFPIWIYKCSSEVKGWVRGEALTRNLDKSNSNCDNGSELHQEFFGRGGLNL